MNRYQFNVIFLNILLSNCIVNTVIQMNDFEWLWMIMSNDIKMKKKITKRIKNNSIWYLQWKISQCIVVQFQVRNFATNTVWFSVYFITLPSNGNRIKQNTIFHHQQQERIRKLEWQMQLKSKMLNWVNNRQ